MRGARLGATRLDHAPGPAVGVARDLAVAVVLALVGPALLVHTLTLALVVHILEYPSGAVPGM